MVDMWGRYTDDLKESNHKIGAVIDKVKGW